jgi:hypothetical protein
MIEYPPAIGPTGPSLTRPSAAMLFAIGVKQVATVLHGRTERLSSTRGPEAMSLQ